MEQNFKAIFLFKPSSVEVYLDLYLMYQFGPIITALVVEKGYAVPMINYCVNLGEISEDIVRLLELNHESEIVLLRYDLKRNGYEEFLKLSVEAFRSTLEENNFRWGKYYQQ